MTFGVSRGSLYNWISRYAENRLQPNKCGPKIKITKSIQQYICNYVLRRTIFKYQLLQKQINKKYSITISKSTIYNVLKTNKVSYKRIKSKPVYKTFTKHMNDKRQFRSKVLPINENDIISIDECHFDNTLIPIYGWNHKGKEIIKNNYVRVRERYTLICAISTSSIVHYEIIKGSANGEIFTSFMKTLTNKLRKPMNILLDNARIHHYNKVKTLIASTNHKLLFNAAYSPEYNPIEHLFSQLKSKIRIQNLNGIKLKSSLIKSLSNVKSEHLHNYFIKSLPKK